jgi:hypothetical protein
MPQLPTIDALNIDKAAVIALAADALPLMLSSETDPVARARLIARRAFAEHLTGALARLIETQITDIYQAHTIVSEPRDEVDPDYQDVWDEALSFALEQNLHEIRELIGHDIFEELAGSGVGYHEIGRLSEIAAEIAKVLAPHYCNVSGKSDAKFLSEIGIVKSDLKALVDLAKKTPAANGEQAEAAEGEIIDDEEAEVENDPVVHAGAPTKDELSVAFKAWAEASGPDFKDFATRLDISHSTVRNYAIGKTNPKLDETQAKVLMQDCDDCIGKLERARAVFRRVRATNGKA